jgi:hypothetical protein
MATMLRLVVAVKSMNIAQPGEPPLLAGPGFANRVCPKDEAVTKAAVAAQARIFMVIYLSQAGSRACIVRSDFDGRPNIPS